MILSYNEVIPKKFINLDGIPYEVLSSHVFRKQQRKPVNQTKLRNLLNGKQIEKTFHQPDKIESAEIEFRKIKFLYQNKEEFWFCEENNPKERFKIDGNAISIKFLKENSLVDAMFFDDKAIGIKLPTKLDLKVVEAPPANKGNTVSGANKPVKVETGDFVTVPIFIKEGDIIRVNTEKGEYVERVTN
ncbi:elongation factor P [Patescibacteria group bacterium]|nr:elongation factor P [Patescibacteria group bacterium]